MFYRIKGFGVRLWNFDFLVGVHLPIPEGYDFEVFDLRWHECDKDLKLSLVVINIEVKLTYFLKADTE